MVIDCGRVNAIYRLHHEEKWSKRRIARELHVARKTINKYLASPAAAAAPRKPRKTKLDDFKAVIREFVERDRKASAVVIAERLRPMGYTGELTILRRYLRTLRDIVHVPRAFIRVESSPGDRFEIDWGHFGALDYSGDKRKLYAFCLIECHSRRLFVEFTHSQSLETFVRSHIHAFQFMTGVARECLYDNLWTAVTERDGRIVRFNQRFLAFAREFGFYPRACNPAAAWEKGKIERGGIGYLRQSFWPLRTFHDLADVNRQVRLWLDEIANKRIHSETRERPADRFRPETLRPLPALFPDYRESVTAKVHKDIRLCFDGNRYCVPRRYVGRILTVKADSSSVAVYDQDHAIIRYPRSWKRGQTFGADRFEKEMLRQRPGAFGTKGQQRLVTHELPGVYSQRRVGSSIPLQMAPNYLAASRNKLQPASCAVCESESWHTGDGGRQGGRPALHQGLTGVARRTDSREIYRTLQYPQRFRADLVPFLVHPTARPWIHHR